MTLNDKESNWNDGYKKPLEQILKLGDTEINVNSEDKAVQFKQEYSGQIFEFDSPCYKLICEFIFGYHSNTVNAKIKAHFRKKKIKNILNETK